MNNTIKYCLFMFFNVTFNNISVISWWCFIGGGNWRTRRNHQPVASQVTDKLYHIMFYRVQLAYKISEISKELTMTIQTVNCLKWTKLKKHRKISSVYCFDQVFVFEFVHEAWFVVSKTTIHNHTCSSIQTRYPDSESTSLCSFHLMLCA